MATSLQDWCDQLHAAITAEDRGLLVQLIEELRVRNPAAAAELALALSAGGIVTTSTATK